MDPLIGAGIAQGAANIIGNLASGASKKKAMKRQHEYNKYYIGRQEEWNKYIMDYNKPVNQMDRYREAGLNPHLIYGQGETGNANQGIDTKNVQALAQEYQAPDVLGMYMAQRLNKAQVNNVEENTRNTRAQTELALLDKVIKSYGIKSAKARAEIDTVLSNYQEDIVTTQLAKERATIGKDLAQIELTKQQEKIAIETIKKVKSEVDNLKKQGKLIDENVLKVRTEKALNEIDIEFAKKNNTSRLDTPALRTIKEVLSALLEPLEKEKSSWEKKIENMYNNKKLPRTGSW